MKVYLDGDADLPTICGTGLEDYVGTRVGHGRARRALRRRAARGRARRRGAGMPDFVGFYRWHVPDPIMFARDLRVTIQQIGADVFTAGQEARVRGVRGRRTPSPATGWMRDLAPGVLACGIAERVDDYCATAFVYCPEPQPVPRLDVAAALADIGRRDHEGPLPFEGLSNLLAGQG